MKQGKTLQELAATIQFNRDNKRDFIVPTQRLAMQVKDGDINLNLDGKESFGVKSLAHRQIATWANIPAKYYDRLLADEKHLPVLAHNVNHWFAEQPAKRMVRTLGEARAFLSDRYRRIDNEQIAEAVFPILGDMGENAMVQSCEITDTRLYIKVVFPRVEGEVKVNDPVQSGLSISNSEVGLGTIIISPLLYRLVCSNGLVLADRGIKQRHVGGHVEADDMEIYRQETIRADDRALMMKVQDTVRAAVDQTKFNNLLERVRETTEGVEVKRPIPAVEQLGKTLGLTEGEQSDVLGHLARGGDLSRWGMLNAVTATANDHHSYDRASEIEAMGGRVLNLSRSEWSTIALAA